MMKPLSASAILALALAGAACSEAAHDEGATPDTPPVVEASAPAEDNGFNLMVPGEDDGADVGGFNLGVNENVTDDGFALPDNIGGDRLGDIGEIEVDSTQPDLSPDLPVTTEIEPEDDLIRVD